MTSTGLAEIILLDGLTCVYRSNVDLFFYVIGSSQENELILVSVLNCLYDAISSVLRKNVEKKALLENMDVAMLLLDEVCDDGYVGSCSLKWDDFVKFRIVLETDAQALVQRCALRPDEIAFGDQSLSQVGMSVSSESSYSHVVNSQNFSSSARRKTNSSGLSSSEGQPHLVLPTTLNYSPLIPVRTVLCTFTRVALNGPSVILINSFELSFCDLT